jgi:hypothetical protein
MAGDGGADVHIGNPIAVGEAEGLIAHVALHPLQATARKSVFAGIHQGDFPGLGIYLVHLHRIGTHVEDHINHVQEIIGEILLDHIAVIAAADHKWVDAKAALALEDVPQNWPTTDFHRRLRLEMGLFANAGTQATGQDHGFHKRTRSRGISGGKLFRRAFGCASLRPTSCPMAE